MRRAAIFLLFLVAACTGCSSPNYPLDAELVGPAALDLCDLVEGMADGSIPCESLTQADKERYARTAAELRLVIAEAQTADLLPVSK